MLREHLVKRFCEIVDRFPKRVYGSATIKGRTPIVSEPLPLP